MPPNAPREATQPPPGPPRSCQSYRHEAFLWSNSADFAQGLVPFVQDGIDAGEAVMVALVPEHAAWVRAGLDTHQASQVQFVDMAKLGRNPAQIIPGWQEFLTHHSGYGRPARGIGEPIWAGRRAEEVLECQLHEALLNVAVDPELPFWLVCPYDLERLDDSAVAEAHRSHPVIVGKDSYYGSPSYKGWAHADAMFHAELPPMPGLPVEFTFTAGQVEDVFALLEREGVRAGLGSNQLVNLATAARRIAHDWVAGGAIGGTVRVWDHPRALTCEMASTTVVNDLLAGRRSPGADDDDPLWWANRVCDLVQFRSTSIGTTIRLHTWK